MNGTSYMKVVQPSKVKADVDCSTLFAGNGEAGKSFNLLEQAFENTRGGISLSSTTSAKGLSFQSIFTLEQAVEKKEQGKDHDCSSFLPLRVQSDMKERKKEAKYAAAEKMCAKLRDLSEKDKIKLVEACKFKKEKAAERLLSFLQVRTHVRRGSHAPERTAVLDLNDLFGHRGDKVQVKYAFEEQIEERAPGDTTPVGHRHLATCRLLDMSTTSSGSAAAVLAEGKGPAKISKPETKRHAAHALLGAISRMSPKELAVLGKDSTIIIKECRDRYLDALCRGSKLVRGGYFKREEDCTLEFKGR